MIHFALAHFPIALLITGALLLVAGLVARHGGTQSVAIVMSMAGAVFSIPTVGAGLWLAATDEAQHPETLALHRLLGISTMVAALMGTGAHLLRERSAHASPTRNVLFLAAAGLALGAGSLGGEMAHGEHHEKPGDHAHPKAGHVVGEHAAAGQHGRADEHHSPANAGQSRTGTAHRATQCNADAACAPDRPQQPVPGHEAGEQQQRGRDLPSTESPAGGRAEPSAVKDTPFHAGQRRDTSKHEHTHQH